MPPFLSPKTPRQHNSRSDLRPPSPNYFALKVDPSANPVKSTGSAVAQTPWTPSSSQFFTTAGASPQKIVANNPDYEAFLRYAQENRIDLAKNTVLPQVYPPSPPSILPPSNKSSSHSRSIPSSSTAPKPSAPLPITKAETVSNDEVTHSSRSPKRLPSFDPSQLANGSRRQSPADFNDHASARSFGSPTRRSDEKALRNLTSSVSAADTPGIATLHHASSNPSPSEANAPSLITPQRAVEMVNRNRAEALILDLRVSTQYAQAHIRGALNLCIPTTLLKRSSYNVSRLADTFKDESQKAKFSSWRSCSVLVVYDSNSSQLREASNCVNILKKFSSEGWQGQRFIIRGGFMEASRTCPEHIDRSGSGMAQDLSADLEARSENTDLPPVVGGCPMPATKNAANPFFANIRQNMDLIDGVGQISIQCPTSLTKRDQEELPQWLRRAINERDEGKTASDKFLNIEKREQKRMQQALSGDTASNAISPSVGPVKKVEIAGIEKGAKNRYNNIFPYEHSRVRLKDLPRDACDYVNASFMQTSMSHKKYIATQGPIPATFDDFWNMVWQRDVRVIVMLTAEFEGGQVKAHNYWKDKRYGPVKINSHSEYRAVLNGTRIKSPKEKFQAQRRLSHMDSAPSSNLPPSREQPPEVIIRKFTISHDAHPFQRMREVTHLQYANWPDFGAPAHPLHLLRLVEQCDSVVRATSSGPRDGPDPPTDRPVLVHCSAGCGRTGTFCTVDTVIDVLKRQQRHRQRPRQPTPMDVDSSPSPKSERSFKPSLSSSSKSKGLEGEWLTRDDIDLIERAVDEFRVQRLSMVQSLRQFVLCYESILEWIAQLGEPKTA